MSQPTGTAAKYGATPGKLILIGVLAVVLFGVVYWNYWRSPSAAGHPSSGAAESSDGSSARAENSGENLRTKEKAAGDDDSSRLDAGGVPWPEVELSAVIAHDPFALPSQFPQPEEAVAEAAPATEITPVKPDEAEKTTQQRAAALLSIRKQGVELVLRNGTEYVAKIGDRQVRVGDTIEGFRVIDINLSGVILEGDSSQ